VGRSVVTAIDERPTGRSVVPAVDAGLAGRSAAAAIGVNTSPNGPPAGGVARVNVIDAIDAAPFGRLQLRIIILCLLVSMLDGFDTQAADSRPD
jgi:hypothetical protein